MIKNRFATWALSEKDEKILIALELNTKSLQVEIKIIPALDLPNELSDKILKVWPTGEDLEFPTNTTITHTSFADESILPDSIKVEGKSGAIRQLQNEWSYLLLNIKLFEQFILKLDEIKLKAMELTSFSHELYEETKGFWEEVLEYRKEKEISQDKVNGIREEVDLVFEHLKKLKENLMKEKDENTERVKAAIDEQLKQIQIKLDEKSVHFKNLMDELKNIQNHLKSQDVKREIKNALFDDINSCFEKVKTKRDEVLGGSNNSRIEGLKLVAERMQKSYDFDKKDFDYNTKKLETANNKLEQQLREAKIKVMQDKMTSKEEKLKDILDSIAKLEKKSIKPAKSDEKERKVEKSNEHIPEFKESKKKEKVEALIAENNENQSTETDLNEVTPIIADKVETTIENSQATPNEIVEPKTIEPEAVQENQSEDSQ